MVYCPSCGAGLRFDIATQQMACDYCQGHFDPQRLLDLTRNDAKTERTYESYAYICPACGAELLTNDKQDAIGFCPYCGGASMLFDKIRRDWKPDCVIPFSVTKEQCREAYVKEVKRHPFVSRKYRDPQLIESFRGIYMPYWSYRATVDGNFRLVASPVKRGAVQESVDTSVKYTFTGEAHRTIDGYTHDASVAFDDHLSEKLAPFDTDKQAPFHPGYLCGFYAEAGDADPKTYRRLAEQELLQYTCEQIAGEAREKAEVPGKLAYLTEASQVPLKITEARQVLYPVWFMSYRRKNTITYATVNGQTGKIGADLPLSPLRILLAALGAAAALYALLWGLMQLLPSVKAKTALALCALLTLAGLFVMEHAYARTVAKALRNVTADAPGKPQKEKAAPTAAAPTPLSLGRYLLFMALAMLGILLYVSDGSYDRVLGTPGGLLFAVMAVFLVIFHVTQGKTLSKLKSVTLAADHSLNSGILTAAKRLLTPLTIMRITVMVLAGVCMLFVLSDSPTDLLYYSLSVGMMALLMGICAVHIRFQIAVAKRRLPQFDKKGARYDEQ